jgi:hypothetical protein
MRVSVPATRRVLRTSKRRLRSGWNGWVIVAHPKRGLLVCAVSLKFLAEKGKIVVTISLIAKIQCVRTAYNWIFFSNSMARCWVGLGVVTISKVAISSKVPGT